VTKRPAGCRLPDHITVPVGAAAAAKFRKSGSRGKDINRFR
jgi:hypothetical protein